MLESDGADTLVGRSFKGFRVSRFIARGGMGMVYEGVQESLDRPVAIKFLYPHLSDDGQFRERFELEARHHARLSHPNIVHILDYGSEGILYYMVMDLVEGHSLRDQLVRIQQEGLTMRTDTILRVVQQIGSALSYAHRHGYVHRDVKPGNILLTPDGQAILTDFGVVKILGDNQLTATGMIIGTPEYMSPEQGRGAIKDIGPASDQYSLAVVTYEMMVGKVPFGGESSHQILQMQLTEPPPPPSSIVPWFAPEIEAVLMKALSKEPADRYASVDDFVKALTAAVESARKLSRPISQPLASAVAPAPTPAATPAPATTAPTPATAPAEAAATPGSAEPVLAGAGTGGSGLAVPAPATGAFSGPRRYLAAAVILVLAILAVFGAVSLLGDRGGSGADASGTNGAPAAAATSTTSATAAVASVATPTSSAQPVNASLAPGGSRGTPTPTGGQAGAGAPPGYQLAVLFSSHRGGIHDSEIYIMGMDGSGQRQLTESRGHSWAPKVSPDGAHFFFSSVAPGEHTVHDASGGGTTGSGNHDIYVGDLTGNTVDNIQTVNINNVTAGFTSWDNGWSWSPDGKWIVFTTDRDGNWEIYKMTPDGKNITRLTNNPAQDGWPTFTPDGQHIVFNSDRTGNWEIFMMNPDGQNVKQISDRPQTINLYPEVSPDGKQIIFSAQVASVNEGEIYVMNIDGTNVRRLTNTTALNNIPSYCPDGNQIVFTSDRDGNENVYLMNADGSQQVALTTDPGEDTTPDCTYIKQSAP